MKVLYSKLNCPGCIVKKNELIKEECYRKKICFLRMGWHSLKKS